MRSKRARPCDPRTHLGSFAASARTIGELVHRVDSWQARRMRGSNFFVRRSPALLAFAHVVACAAGGGGVAHEGGGGTDGGGVTFPSGNGGTGAGDALNFGGLQSVAGDADARHTKHCDDAGNCSCITIASIGHEGVWGPCSSDTTTAFQNWLNTQSTAKVDNFDTAKPTLTADFLSRYDVIILQWMVENGQQNNDGAPWQFSDAEVVALKDWVNKGGGVIALSGYQCEDPACIQDIVATNQLLSFTDIQFNRDVVLSPKVVNNNDFYCWGGSVPLGGAIGSGIYTTGSWDQSSPVGVHVMDVGAYDARSIQSSSASVDCSDGSLEYAVHEQIGQGHVVAYGDEWITYTGEWTGLASCLNAGAFTNMYDPCYQKSPAQIFQISQFWYNAIKYAASSVACFDIRSPGIVK